MTADHATRSERTHPRTARDTMLPLRRTGSRPPLFCVHPGGGFAITYSGLTRLVDNQVPVHGLQARGLLTPEPLPSSVEEMSRDYVDQIRAVQPAGPYRLAGWCFGGRMAYEMACLLTELGEQVDLLVLMDSYPPPPGPVPDDVAMLADLLMPPDRAQAGADLAVACRPPLDYGRIHDYLVRTNHYLMHLDEEMLFAVYRVYCNNERLHRSPISTAFRGNLLCLNAAEAYSDDGRPSDALSDGRPSGGLSDARPSGGYPSGGHPSDGWRAHVAGTVEAHRLECRHGDFMSPGPLQQIAAIVNEKLSLLAP